MKLSTLFVCVAATVAIAWFGPSASAQPVGQSVAVVQALSEMPVTGENAAPYASYVVLIPTHEETRASPELLVALRHVSEELASAPEQSPSGAAFLGAPETGGFDAAASALTIDDLNARYGFGFDRSDGAILLFAHGNPVSAAREDVYALVFETNDASAIAAAMQDASLGLINKGIGPEAPPSLWELIEHLLVPSTAPKPPHE